MIIITIIKANDYMDFPGSSDGKESACNCRRLGFNPRVGKIPWRREWQPPPVILPGEFHRQRYLVGYSPWGCKESDTTELIYCLFFSRPHFKQFF